MRTRNPTTHLATHDVTNQPSALEDVNLYDLDAALKSAVARGEGDWAEERLRTFGARVGSAEVQEQAQEANRHPPQLRTFDRFGQRLDEVSFHPDYHALMTLGVDAGTCAVAWDAPRGGHVVHAALLYLLTQADPGVCCPVSMTYAAMPVLRQHAALTDQWQPKLLSATYDSHFQPAANKRGVTIGMAMTEKQGGSDVRANTTTAVPVSSNGDYELVGHKWFCSAPMSDAFFTLAQTDAGLSCFFVPRWRPDDTRNAIHIMRLKDKLGDRSNASSEIEYHGAHATLVGEQGHGVRTIIDMVQGTRLDCMVGSAGLMRAALAEALWHCAQRQAFGRPLARQPVMAKVLADLVVEHEAAVALVFTVANAFDAAATDPAAAALARVLTPIAKYWVCKRTPGFVYEAMECLGGAGYVEESSMPRLFRQSPLNSIWEGSGNVIALDTLRVVEREPAAIGALFDWLRSLGTTDRRLTKRIEDLESRLANGAPDVSAARHLVEQLALVCQGALLRAHAPDPIADAFARTRLDDSNAMTYGAFAASVDSRYLIERALPLTSK